MDFDKKTSEYIDKYVVLDTATSIVYIGILKSVGADYFELADVDIHDCSEGANTKEKYLMETKRHGVRLNRTRVMVRMNVVMSLSLLDDVYLY